MPEDTMAKHVPLTIAAALLATTVAAATAQTAKDIESHHIAASQAIADAAAPQTSGCPGGVAAGDMSAGNTGAMMGGGPGQTMQMMGGGSAMTPFAHVEGRIAFLKTELGITDAQAPQWNAFADALRSGAKAMRESMAGMMQAGKPPNAADRTDAMVKMITARLESLKPIAAAEKALYAVLTDPQKETADELLGGPMMGMGGSMMGMGQRM